VLVLLEERAVESGVWHRVRVVEPKGGLSAGTEGWISATLLK
jgi:hypothetical protein